jgi:hypothetical protein
MTCSCGLPGVVAGRGKNRATPLKWFAGVPGNPNVA